ncbi:hypothetical protein ACGFWE_05715 [Streptomyces sp. NPDC048523]|uniref:hypothetical protein n=1 Tax=Streptomyces sp. NPDC048523 TaxID=3365567 RepID=UPI00371C65EE
MRSAVATYREAVDGLVSVLGRLHHDTIIARHNLAYWHGIAGDHGLAVEQFLMAADDAELALGSEHPTTLTCHTNLAFWRCRTAPGTMPRQIGTPLPYKWRQSSPRSHADRARARSRCCARPDFG